MIFIELLRLLPLLGSPVGVLGEGFFLKFVPLVTIITVRFKCVLEDLKAFLLHLLFNTVDFGAI